jgi:hypothetical protein
MRRGGGNGCRKRLDLAHVKLLQDILYEFALMHKCPILGLLDFAAQANINMLISNSLLIVSENLETRA